MSSGKVVFLYKRSVDPIYWQSYLSRKLTNDEKHLLFSTKQEQQLNDEILKIYNVAKNDGLYIPELTELDGNCLFESLRILNLYNDSQLFRIGFAQLLLILKNVHGVLPGFSESLDEIYQNFRDCNYVICSKTKKAYYYNYDAMCVDLAKNSTWTRFNTELLMRILCAILNINIIIYHHNGHITNINNHINEDTINIYLGQTGDATQKNDSGFHYIPLQKIHLLENQEFPKCPAYKENLVEYLQKLLHLI